MKRVKEVSTKGETKKNLSTSVKVLLVGHKVAMGSRSFGGTPIRLFLDRQSSEPITN